MPPLWSQPGLVNPPPSNNQLLATNTVAELHSPVNSSIAESFRYLQAISRKIYFGNQGRLAINYHLSS